MQTNIENSTAKNESCKVYVAKLDLRATLANMLHGDILDVEDGEYTPRSVSTLICKWKRQGKLPASNIYHVTTLGQGHGLTVSCLNPNKIRRQVES